MCWCVNAERDKPGARCRRACFHALDHPHAQEGAMLPAINRELRRGRRVPGHRDRKLRTLRHLVQDRRDRLELDRAGRPLGCRCRRRTLGKATTPGARRRGCVIPGRMAARVGFLGDCVVLHRDGSRQFIIALFNTTAAALGVAARLARRRSNRYLSLGGSTIAGRARHRPIRARHPVSELHDQRAEQREHQAQGLDQSERRAGGRLPPHICSIRPTPGGFFPGTPNSCPSCLSDRTGTEPNRLGTRFQGLPAALLALISSSCSWYPWIWARSSSA